MATKTAISKNQLPKSYLEVLQTVGFFIQYWGFKEVHGQVWACIFLADKPVDANHIIAQLKLSKAAISLAIKDLTHYSVIQELEKKEPSTRKYISNPNLVEVILNVLRQREKKMLSQIVAATKALSDLDKNDLSKWSVSKEKTKALMSMSQGAQAILDQILIEDDVDMSQMFALLQM